VELSELAGIRRAQIEKMKAFLSRTTDRGRKAYGHYPADQPRSCLFVSLGRRHFLDRSRSTPGAKKRLGRLGPYHLPAKNKKFEEPYLPPSQNIKF
jgi:hypothetical protein